MNIRSRFTIFGAAALVAAAGSLAFAQNQPSKDKKPAPAPGNTAPAAPSTNSPAKKPAANTPPANEHPDLPAGMSQADMEACMAAATPGPMHEHLAKGVGVWQGKTSMWMTPGAEPMHGTCTSTITSMLDGRFTKCETTGDMPGMEGMVFTGFGVYGFDNVSQKFQSTWVDSMGTGMAIGTGELSSDAKTLTWTCRYNCPVQKKEVTMREVDRYTGKDTMTMEMHMVDPASGKEYKMMEIQLTRKPGTGPATATGTPKSTNMR